MLSNILKTSAIVLALSLAACSDDDSNNNNGGNTVVTKTGVFIDAPVVGLGYQTPTQQGTTNASGEFTYTDGEQVTFYLDGFELGSTTAMERVPVTMLSNTLAIARVLQTLDTNPAEEIIDVSEVTLTDTQKASFQQVLNKEIHVSQIGLNNIVREEVAADHIKKYIGTQKWNEGLLAGKTYEDINEESALTISFNANYTGTFSETIGTDTFSADFTWGLDTAMDYLNMTILSDEGDEVVQIQFMGQQDDGVLDLFGVDAESQESFATEWTPVTP